jgi:hypothetical protein
MHFWESPNKGVWYFIDPKYWLDFKNALDSYWLEINNPKNKLYAKRLFSRERQVNFLKFG